MTESRRRTALAAAAARLAAAALLAAASPALARIPEAETVARAAADASRAQGRTKPFRLGVSVRPALDAPPIARGELLVDPTGSARIELRHEEGFVERQLRRAGGLAASRDGAPLEDAHPLVPPFWLVQTGTGGELLARAGELGAAPGAVALAYDGPRDCYVVGGATGGPSVWIDKETYQVARADLSDGTRYRFLGWASRGGAVLPGVIEIETPLLSFVLEVTSAAPATIAADAFSNAWLSSP